MAQIDLVPSAPIRTEPLTGADALPQHADRFERLEIVTDPGSIVSETIRAVRTRLLAQHVRLGRRALAVCSVTPSAHAGFIAANLAVAMAQGGVRTLLVDADLRTPRLADMFGIPADAPGLSDFLTQDRLELDDVSRTMLLPALTVMTAGTPSSAPQELLTSEAFGAFANQSMREHDLTLFCTTPSARCTDAQRVAAVAGYSLLVARKDKSYARDIATLTKLLRSDGAVIAGSVLLAA